MPNTPRMQWPYPEQFADPWYDAYTAQVTSMDASGYAAREDRNAILMGGGTVSFTALSGQLSWSAPIQILSAPTGFVCTIAAGSVLLNEGDIFYTELVRSPINNPTVPALKGTQAPSTDGAFMLAIRQGDRVYFRDGMVIQNGQSGELILLGGLGGGMGMPGLAVLPSPSVDAGDAAIVGVSGLAARQDHQHAVNTGAAADLAAVDAAVAFAGVSLKLPRADHKHTVSVGLPVATGTVNATGGAISLARSDHVHRLQVGVRQSGMTISARPYLNFINATVTDDVMNDAVSITIPAATPGIPVETGTANAGGVAATFARSDHVHRTIIHARQGGMDIGGRPYLNFGGSVTVADNVGTDALDITVSGGIPTGQKIKSDVTLGLNEIVVAAVATPIGAFNLNTADYAITGTTLQMRLVAVLSVSTIGASGTVTISAGGMAVASVICISRSPVKFISPDFTVPAGDNLITLEASVAGGGNVRVWYAGIQIDRVF